MGSEEISKEYLARLAHILSSRQLVPGGVKVSSKAFKAFAENMTSDFPVSEKFLKKVFRAAKTIGSVLSERKPTRLDGGHISVSMAGSFSSSIKDGGRAQEIRDDVIELMKTCPAESGEIEIPFVKWKFRELQGVPRWQTWGRETPLEKPLRFYDLDEELKAVLGEDLTFIYPGEKFEFGEIRGDITLRGEWHHRWGFDEALGIQILSVALLKAKQHLDMGVPLPCRVLTVPEPGGKVRIVTTTPWWVIIIQQSVSHVMTGVLKYHPSVTTLQMGDQIWLWLRLLTKSDLGSLNEPWFLSSDLKEATDRIPLPIADALLRGFYSGIGVANLPMFELARELLLTPHVLFLPDSIIEKGRGVLMGEPLTKTVLTLQNAVCELMALWSVTGKKGPIRTRSTPWRAFGLGGDDLIAVGPKCYLDKITSNLEKCGARLSPDKHGVSRFALKYTERLVYLKEITNWDKSMNVVPGNYPSHPCIDSIKVRLLSPLGKSLEVKNDRNVAIGKGAALGKVIKWLPKQCFSNAWKNLARARFIQRMGPYLPSSSENPTLAAQILLPATLGGLDLFFDEDLPGLYRKLPYPTRVVITALLTLKDDRVEEARLCLASFVTNSTIRGFELKANLREWVRSTIQSLVPSGSPWTLVGDRGVSLADRLAFLRTKGWFTLWESVKLILRPFLFADILSGKSPASTYNTEKWVSRYHRIWDQVTVLLPGVTPLEDVSPQDLLKVFKAVPIPPLYHLGSVETVSYDRPDGEHVEISMSVTDELTADLPSLAIKPEWLGLMRSGKIPAVPFANYSHWGQ